MTRRSVRGFGLRTERQARIIEWEVEYHDLTLSGDALEAYLFCTNDLCVFVREGLLYDVSDSPAIDPELSS